MKTILITGGAGFIGYHLTKKLLKEGNTVISVDNFITSDSANIESLLRDKNFTFFEHDIISPLTFLSGNFPNIDTIFHLACPTGVPNLITLAEEMILTCSFGTRNVLELAQEINASLVFASSSEVYGDPEKFPQSEDYTGNVNPIGLRSPYEEGKRFSESLVMMYVRKYGLNAKIVRIFNSYGPNMSQNDTRVIPNFLTSLITGKPILINGTGDQKRTFCYVDDLVEGLAVVERHGKRGEIYNIGSEDEISINDLARLMQSVAQVKSKVLHTSIFEDDHKRRLPDLGKIKNLGWDAKITLEKGLLKTFQSRQRVPYEIRLQQ